METLKELRKICQKPNYKTEGNWMARHITRDMALPITRLLLFTPVTANHVTTISILVILSAAFLFSSGTIPSIFWGSVLFQLWYLLDHVDGQIARYRKSASASGIFYDFVSHHIVNLSILSSLGMGVFRSTGDSFFLMAGFVGAGSILLFHLIFESKYKTFFAVWSKAAKELKKPIGVQIHPSGPAKKKNPAQFRPKSIVSYLKILYSILHKICEVHVLMNLLTLVAAVSFLNKDIQGITLFVLVYAFIAPLVFTLKMIYLVKNRVIDEEISEYIPG
jgi:hypothetical protein